MALRSVLTAPRTRRWTSVDDRFLHPSQQDLKYRAGASHGPSDAARFHDVAQPPPKLLARRI
jgi:hypothetical protein